MLDAITNELKKIIFSRNKKNPTITDRDKNTLNKLINSKISQLVNDGTSNESASFLLKSALNLRISQLFEIKKDYKSYSRKDTYTSFLDNLITVHQSEIDNLTKNESKES